MEPLPAANPTIPPARRRPLLSRPWLLVFLILLFVGCLRVRMLSNPLERDEGEYAYAGQLILQGIPPYELAYNMKLPGTYYAYAVGMALFGQTATGVHLTLLVVNSLTCIFIFLLGRKLYGNVAGVAACASYAFLSMTPWVYGLAAHATQFVVVFGVPGTLLLWLAAESGRRRFFCLGGLCYGLAFLMKQQGLCFGLAGLTFLLWDAVSKRALLKRDFFVKLLLFSGAMALPLIFVSVSCAVAGDFSRFWFWTFKYAGVYASTVPLADGAALLCQYLEGNSPVYIGYWLLAVAGLSLALRSGRCRREFFLTLALLFFSFCGTAAGLYFRPHYFILLLPPLALLVGAAVAFLRSSLPPKARIIAPAALVAVTAWVIYHEPAASRKITPPDYFENMYVHNPFGEAIGVSQYIRAHSKPDALVAVVGSEPEIYFYTGRHSATGYIYTYALMEGTPTATAMQREMIGEIEAAKPEFIVLVMYKFSWLAFPQADRSIFKWTGDYTREFYDRAGIVGRQSDDKIVWVNGASTASAHELFDEYIVVYQRKPGAG